MYTFISVYVCEYVYVMCVCLLYLHVLKPSHGFVLLNFVLTAGLCRVDLTDILGVTLVYDDFFFKKNIYIYV